MEVLAEEVDYLKNLNNSFIKKYVSKNYKDTNRNYNEGRIKSYIKENKITAIQKPKIQTIDESLPVDKKKFHKLTSSYDFLKGIPTTKIHNILQLEKKLKMEGTIKSRYEKDLFWLTANKTWFKKNTKRNISIEVLKEHVIKAYDRARLKKKTFLNKPKVEDNAIQKLMPPSEIMKISRPSSLSLKFPRKPSFPQLRSFNSSYQNKFSCIVPKLEVTNNVRQYKKVKPNDRLRTVEKNYHQTNLYHVEKCNAYQVAILNKAATSMMIKRTKFEVQRPKSYNVNDICINENTSQYKKIKEPINRNKKFLKEPSIDSNVLKKSNLIPLPPIKPKSIGKQEKKVVNSALKSKKEKSYIYVTPLSFEDLFDKAENDNIKKVESTIEMWSNYS